MTAVMDRHTTARCHFCQVEKPALNAAGWAVRSFLGTIWHACPAHNAPYPTCATPTECRGSCRAEFACDD
jgi:hypothetical protein